MNEEQRFRVRHVGVSHRRERPDALLDKNADQEVAREINDILVVGPARSLIRT